MMNLTKMEDTDFQKLQRQVNELNDKIDELSFSYYKKTGSGSRTITGSELKSDNFITGTQGWRLLPTGDFEANDGTFRGTLTANSINIPNTTTNNSFHTDSNGNSWWGCNVADFTSSNENADAYILNTGVAKIGTSNGYLKFDGTATIYSGNIFHDYTAGESIGAGEIVCIKSSTETYSITDSAYINQQAPTTNYNGTVDHVSINGGDSNGAEQSYFHVNTSLMPNDIQKAVLRLYMPSITVGWIDVRLHRVTSAWDYDTITWNTKPTEEAFGEYYLRCAQGAPGYVDFDITNLIRRFKSDGSNNGFMIKAISQDDNQRYVWFASETYTVDETDRPSIIITSNESSDGKIYKANDTSTIASDDYNLCRNIIGIAKTSGTATISVYDGFNTTISSLGLTEGLRYYLGSGGAFTYDATETTHTVFMGLGRSNGIILRPDLPIYIERYPAINIINDTTYGTTGVGAATVIAPFESNRCLIKYDYDNGANIYYSGTLIINRSGHKTDIQKRVEVDTTVISATWSGNIITITGISTTQWRCYFYSK